MSAAHWVKVGGDGAKRKLALSLAAVLGGILALLAFVPFVSSFGPTFLVEFSRESTLAGFESGFEGLATPLVLGMQLSDTGFRALPGYYTVLSPLLLVLGWLISTRGLHVPSPVTGDDRTRRNVMRVSLLWIGLSFLTFMMQNTIQFRPRYWMNLFVPVTVLVVLFASGRTGRAAPHARMSTLPLSITIAWLLRPLFLSVIARAGVPLRTPEAMLLLTILIAAAAFGISVLLRSILRFPVLHRRNPFLIGRRYLLPGLAVLWAVQVLSFVADPSFTIRDTSRLIGERLNGSGAVLTGGVANTLVMETDLFAYETRDLAAMGMAKEHIILNGNHRKLGATHVLMTVEVEGMRSTGPWVLPVSLSPVAEYPLVPVRHGDRPYRYIAALFEIR